MSSSDAPLLAVEGLSAAWEGVPVLRDIAFTVHPREFVVLLGPNGSGKTTLLRCLVGLEPVTTGAVRLKGRNLAGVPTHRRGIGMLFQDAALFPHRSVWENIAYAPLLQGRSDAEVAREVDRTSALLRVQALLDRRPDELSGGERQRVALARTIAAEPRLVLLDEPFASIDMEVKAELRADFRRALAERGIAAVHVTHDREEAFFLGDRVLLLLAGRIARTGTPAEVFESPGRSDVARFLGYNVVRANGAPVAVHPRWMRLTDAGGGSATADVLATGFAEDGPLIALRLASGERAEARPPEGTPVPAPGARVGIEWTRGIPLAE